MTHNQSVGCLFGMSIAYLQYLHSSDMDFPSFKSEKRFSVTFRTTYVRKRLALLIIFAEFYPHINLW